MPNIKELEKFKDQLLKIANEPEITAKWGERREEIPLPKEMPLPDVNVDDLLGFTEESKAAPEQGQDDLSEFDTADNFPKEKDNFEQEKPDTDESKEIISQNPKEISLFTEALDDDIEPLDDKEENENYSQDFESMLSDLNIDEPSTEDKAQDLNDDFPDVPEALLSGFGDMVEKAREEPEISETSFPDFDTDFTLNSKPDIETIADPEIQDSLEAPGDLGDLEEIGDDADSGLEDLKLDDLKIDDLDSQVDSDTEKTSLSQASEPNYKEFDLSNEDFSDMEEIEPLEDNEGDSIDLSFEDGPIEDDPLSNFDEMDSPSLIESAEISEDEQTSPDFQNGQDEASQNRTFTDIDIPDIDEHTAFAIDDNVLNTEMSGDIDDFSVPESFIQFSPDKNFKFFDSKKQINEEEYEGKIPLSISEDEYDHLIDRISSFPLNLRIEIEDYLVNADDSELNKMEIVHMIVNDASLRRIVGKLESILDKSIPIPRGFDKKSYEEYEKEKRSLKYRFMHKILPAAVLAAVVLGFIFSVFVLVWQFIYKPIVAEGIYKEGIANIESGQYEKALNRFEDAGAYKKKRKWYFKFANAFREKKQFLSAETIYERLLSDFNHDRQGGIEYADMLSTDLRNYEKAEKVLKRGVLDYHINDQGTLLALGDVYLDWADEDSTKYEEARKTFASLINLYGSKDVFSGRMMRYFIRTDNLAEVLPLKNYFLNKKLPDEDLIELSGYLLEKRYEPKPTDSENLIGKIDDLRELLEKSIKKRPESPEANYNMGRFFLHNQKNEAAKDYLVNAINLYEDSIKMTPKRTIRQIDAMRLYGELIAGDKLYNEAQEIYVKALSKYEAYTAQKGIYPSPVVGKLYANYGDISYFIAGDYDEALDAYEHAVRELNNSPSIQYKMGYIYYQKENYSDAMKAMTLAYSEKPNDKNLLYGFGNVLFKYTNYFAAQAYYERLMELLEAEKIRKGIIFPQTRVDHAEFVEDYMHTSNNLAVVLNRIAVQNGDSNKNGRALSLFGESTRAWDALNRNPETMIRAKTINLAYANIQNMVKPRSAFVPEIYSDIPKTLENEKILQQTEDR